MRVLSPEQMQQLHEWLAQGLPYPQLRNMMLASFGVAICASAVTWHRQQYASVIGEIRANLQKRSERRERERAAKARQRARKRGRP